MWSSTACLLAASAIGVVLLLSGVDATVATTCKAASDRDNRINYDFCVSELSKASNGPDVDTRGLAKVAADLGESNAKKAVSDIRDLLTKPGNNAKTKKALEHCQDFYGVAELAFRRAYDRIIDHNSPAATEQVGLAISQAPKCDDALAKAAVNPSPLKQHSWYTVHIGIICTAITNLIQSTTSKYI